MTQPALSLRIRELETSLGERLLNRDSYRATLTARGIEVAQQSERMLEIAERIADRDIPEGDIRGLIRMGATDTFAAHYLPSLLVDIETHFPLAQIELVVEFSVNLYAKLLRGELDVAVLSGPTLSPLLAYDHLLDLPHYWVGRAQALRRHARGDAARAGQDADHHASRAVAAVRNDPGVVCGGGRDAGTLQHVHEPLHQQGARRRGRRVRACCRRRSCATRSGRGALRLVEARPALGTLPLFVAYRRDTAPANVHRFVTRIKGCVRCLRSRRRWWLQHDKEYLSCCARKQTIVRNRRGR